MQKASAGEYLTPLGKRGSVYNYIVTSPGKVCRSRACSILG